MNFFSKLLSLISSFCTLFRVRVNPTATEKVVQSIETAKAVVDDLNEAAAQCQDQIAQNNAQVAALNADSTVHAEHVVKAETVAQGMASVLENH